MYYKDNIVFHISKKNINFTLMNINTEQSGVYKISMQGIVYEVDNRQKPNLIINTEVINRKVHTNYDLSFFVYDTLPDIKRNTGAMVYFYNGDTLLIDRQLNVGLESINSTNSNTLSVNLTTERPLEYGG